jgi:ATP phosphoribosyltransferase
VVLIDRLGFGFANVAVAVPQAWIDVRSMADLDDVATAFRLKHERKMRLATKYANLTRGFFPSTASSTTASSKARARPRRRRRPAPPSSSSTSPRPARRSPPTASR